MKESTKSPARQSQSSREASLDLKPPTHQPSKSEMEQEFDMPGASMETLRKAFFNPIVGTNKQTVKPEKR